MRPEDEVTPAVEGIGGVEPAPPRSPYEELGGRVADALSLRRSR